MNFNPEYEKMRKESAGNQIHALLQKIALSRQSPVLAWVAPLYWKRLFKFLSSLHHLSGK